MTGRITRIVDQTETGTIAGDDGADYLFHSGAVVGTPFDRLRVGDAVVFTPVIGSSVGHAAIVGLMARKPA